MTGAAYLASTPPPFRHAALPRHRRACLLHARTRSPRTMGAPARAVPPVPLFPTCPAFLLGCCHTRTLPTYAPCPLLPCRLPLLTGRWTGQPSMGLWVVVHNRTSLFRTFCVAFTTLPAATPRTRTLCLAPLVRVTWFTAATPATAFGRLRDTAAHARVCCGTLLAPWHLCRVWRAARVIAAATPAPATPTTPPPPPPAVYWIVGSGGHCWLVRYSCS